MKNRALFLGPSLETMFKFIYFYYAFFWNFKGIKKFFFKFSSFFPLKLSFLLSLVVFCRSYFFVCSFLGRSVLGKCFQIDTESSVLFFKQYWFAGQRYSEAFLTQCVVVKSCALRRRRRRFRGSAPGFTLKIFGPGP